MALRILPAPIQTCFLRVLHQNIALYNFHKRGQVSMLFLSRLRPDLLRNVNGRDY